MVTRASEESGGMVIVMILPVDSARKLQCRFYQMEKELLIVWHENENKLERQCMCKTPKNDEGKYE